MKHLTGLYLCNLSDHKFGHNFQDLINPICRSGHDIEITTHWAHYISERQSIVKKKNNILIRMFEFFIISFLLLEKKDLMLLLINIQSCVQLSIHSLHKSSPDSLKGIFDDNLLFYYFTVNSFCCLEVVFRGKTNKNSCQSLLDKSEPVHRTNYICYFFCWRKIY